MISFEDYLWFVDQALDAMVDLVRELGDHLANQRIETPAANTPYAVLTHCLGVMEYWAGHAVAGRAIQRDRDAEFTAHGSVELLVLRVRTARRQLAEDLIGAQPAAPPRCEPELDDGYLPLARTQGGALVHVLEELAQHRGQMEVTRDLLLAERGRPGA